DISQRSQILVCDLDQLLIAEFRLQLALEHGTAHVAGGIGHLVAAQPLLRPSPERLCILDTGLVPRFLLRWRLPGRDHLLGFAQPFPGFRERDASYTIAAEGDGLLSAMDRVVVAE